MKLSTRIMIALGGVVLLSLLFGNTWDYGLNCTRCGYYEHRMQWVFARTPFYEYTMNTRSGYAQAYQELFGQPCPHVMKKGGFGHNPGCGMTAEGMVYSGRNKAVKALFEVYQRTTDRALAQESFVLVEKLFPERTTSISYFSGESERTNQTSIGEMCQYAEWLDQVETSAEWQSVNESVRGDFVVRPTFLADEKLMRSKTNSTSPIVR
jgi:hypothetical protein